MDEMMEARNQDPWDSRKAYLAKWFKYLFILQIISVFLSLSAMLSPQLALATLTQVINVGFSVGLTVILCRLSAVNDYYRKAYIAMIVQVLASAATFVIAKMNTSIAGTMLAGVVSMVTSVSSLVASYMQYQGHRWIAFSGGDKKLANRWNVLFIIMIVVGFAMGGISAGAGVMMGFSGKNPETMLGTIMALVGIPSFILQLVYLWYLYRTWNLFR